MFKIIGFVIMEFWNLHFLEYWLDDSTFNDYHWVKINHYGGYINCAYLTTQPDTHSLEVVHLLNIYIYIHSLQSPFWLVWFLVSIAENCLNNRETRYRKSQDCPWKFSIKLELEECNAKYFALLCSIKYREFMM